MVTLLLHDLYESFDPTLVFGCIVIGVTISKLKHVIVGRLLWSMFVEGVDFFTPASEPPPVFSSWSLDSAVEMAVAFVPMLSVWLLMWMVAAIVNRAGSRKPARLP
jgi:hypothetical protein